MCYVNLDVPDVPDIERTQCCSLLLYRRARRRTNPMLQFTSVQTWQTENELNAAVTRRTTMRRRFVARAISIQTTSSAFVSEKLATAMSVVMTWSMTPQLRPVRSCVAMHVSTRTNRCVVEVSTLNNANCFIIDLVSVVENIIKIVTRTFI